MIRGDSTLREMRAWLQEKLLAGESVKCPLCTQHAKVYRRTINSTQARALLLFFREAGAEYAHGPTVTRSNSDELSKLRYWGLIEESLEKREDGGRAGWWRLTPEGILFAEGLIRVPKYARIYDGRLLGLEGEPVSIRDALGERFDYDLLMSR